MLTFLSHQNIRSELLGLFKNADKYIFLVSPYIKLNEEMKNALSQKKNDLKFQIVVLFGKNNSDLSKSLSRDDMDFFKKFNNVEIYYNENLHGKFYANEKSSIITSLNLHQYSIKNNLEFGVLIDRNFIELNRDKRIDNEAFNYVNTIIDSKDTLEIFIQRTNQKTSFFGLFKGQINQFVEKDSTDKIYLKKEIEQFGYCIRTKVRIPFNKKEPLSTEAKIEWEKYKRGTYVEKYCHCCGNPSNGETSFNKPFLSEHYYNAQRIQESIHGKESKHP